MRKYDAHVHFDCTKKEPYIDLKINLEANNINKCVLILNSIEEEKVFLQNYDAIARDGLIGSIAAILDINARETIEFFSSKEKFKIPISIKLHPRLTNIRRCDFEKIYHTICLIESNTIVVDCFIYGPQLENHIGVELAIYLAQRLENRNIVIAHAGGCELLKTMLLTRPIKNIYYDFSLSCNYLENTSVYFDMVNGLKFWTNKIMYGTDYPDIRFEKAIQAMNKMCLDAELPIEVVENIFYNNAMLVYGEEK